MKINLSVKKYKDSVKIFWITYLITLFITLIINVSIPELRENWITYIAIIIGSLIMPLILLTVYHLKYYKVKK